MVTFTWTSPNRKIQQKKKKEGKKNQQRQKAECWLSFNEESQMCVWMEEKRMVAVGVSILQV